MRPRLYDARGLARVLDVRYDDLLAWARRGEIPSIKAGGRYYFDLRRVLDAMSRVDETLDATEPQPCA